jgi:hypothetical protein
MADESDVLTPTQQEQVADGLEEDAEVMSNTELEQLLDGQSPAVQEEILTSTRTRARSRFRSRC